MGAEHAMSATIVDGWPAVAAKTAVLGLIADHVMPGTGYICLWADDDPGQLAEQTWERIQGTVTFSESATVDLEPRLKGRGRAQPGATSLTTGCSLARSVECSREIEIQRGSLGDGGTIEMLRRVMTVGFVLAMVLSVTSCSGAKPEEIQAGQGRMPASSDDLEGELYTDVVDTLEAAGFTNIETNALGDLITGWLNKPDEVDEVEIDGVVSFDKGDVFRNGVKIVVNYHSFPEKDEPSPEASDPSEPETPTVDLPYWCGEGFGFGNGVPIKLRYTQGNIPVTVTVDAPVALLAGSNPDANASFTVTISNLSSDRTWDPTLFALAVPTSDMETSVINYGEWPTGYETDDVGPGQSLTFADEWNVADLEDVRYELRVDGLAGDTVCFAR